LFCVFLTRSWVTADLAAGIFYIYYAGSSRFRADDCSGFVGFKWMESPIFNNQGLLAASALVVCTKGLQRKGKDSDGSDDTASMIKGGGYIGARTRQPPKGLQGGHMHMFLVCDLHYLKKSAFVC